MDKAAEYAFNWQILLSLVFLFGIAAAVIKPIRSHYKEDKENAVKLNTILTTLDLTIKALQEQLKCNERDNDKEHEEIFDKLDEHEDTLVEHDKAISELRMTAIPYESKR